MAEPRSPKPTAPDSHVMRRMGSNATHVASIQGVSILEFLVPYWTAQNLDIRAACGVRVGKGPIMAPGTKTTCRACVHLTGITEEPPRD